MTDPTNTLATTFVAIWHAVYGTMRCRREDR